MGLGQGGHHRLQPAQPADDHVERDPAEDGEDQGLEGVGPGGAAQAAVADVGHDHRADQQAAGPLRHLAAGDLFQGQAAGHDADQQVGHQQGHEDEEQQQAEPVRLPALPEELGLGQEAVALAEGPDPRAHEEEHAGDDQGRGGGHEGEHADALVVGLARGPEDGEGCHVGAEEGHEQQEGADGAAGHEVVLAGAPEEPVAQGADEDHQAEVDGDDGEGHGWSSPCRSRCAGQARVTSRKSITAAAAQKPTW